MPHITVQMYPGRDDNIKMEIAKAIAEAVSNQMSLDQGTISVSIKEVAKENWKSDVYDKLEGDNSVYIKPAYKM